MAKKDKKAAAPAAAKPGLRLRDHPRAQRDIRRAKGWGGLAVFVLVAILSLRAGVPLSDALLRALGAGVAGVVAAWGLAVLTWHHVAQAELELARRRLVAGLEALEAERERRAAERSA